ncbi:grunge, partial [Reticulomyxa filosa]
RHGVKRSRDDEKSWLETQSKRRRVSPQVTATSRGNGEMAPDDKSLSMSISPVPSAQNQLTTQATIMSGDSLKGHNNSNGNNNNNSSNSNSNNSHYNDTYNNNNNNNNNHNNNKEPISIASAMSGGVAMNTDSNGNNNSNSSGVNPMAVTSCAKCFKMERDVIRLRGEMENEIQEKNRKVQHHQSISETYRSKYEKLSRDVLQKDARIGDLISERDTFKRKCDEQMSKLYEKKTLGLPLLHISFLSATSQCFFFSLF